MRTKGLTICIVIAMALMATRTVCADLAATDTTSSAKVPVSPHLTTSGGKSPASAGQTLQSVKSFSLAQISDQKTELSGRMDLDGKETADSGSTDVKQLPPPPDSATLFMCALGSLGIFQAGRSVKKINLSFVPDWYHNGGPRQIGHAHALDVDLSLLAAPVVVLFDQPVIESDAKVRHYASFEALPLLTSQFSLQIEAPRGPPTLV